MKSSEHVLRPYMRVENAFSPEEVSQMARELLGRGFHPSVVRRRLAERGIRWEYQWRDETGHAQQGIRQRLRNLRSQGLGLCSVCHERPYKLGTANISVVNVCPECLERKWSGQAPMDCPSIADPHV